MSNNILTMTVESQPAFGMPVYGRAAVSCGDVAWTPVVTAAGLAPIQGTTVSTRDRHAALKGSFPGTSVWSPPS